MHNRYCQILKASHSIHFSKEDVVRHELVQQIVEAYEERDAQRLRKTNGI